MLCKEGDILLKIKHLNPKSLQINSTQIFPLENTHRLATGNRQSALPTTQQISKCDCE